MNLQSNSEYDILILSKATPSSLFLYPREQTLPVYP